MSSSSGSSSSPIDSAEKYILAIDLGTSGPKVALVSTAGDVVQAEVESTALDLKPAGGAEQDPDDWWRAICAAAGRVLAKTTIPRSEIVGVCCTAQWSGTVAVDESGRALHPAIIWMDSRGESHVRKLTGGLIEVEGYGAGKLAKWLRLTGGIPAKSGKDSIAHILYIKSELPEVYRATHKFLEPKDYLNFRLTGKFAAGVDSIALHWVTDNRNIKNVRYDKGLLKLSGVDAQKLPELKQAVDVLGPLTRQAAQELGLSTDVQVVMGTPDLHSAALGSGAARDFEGHIYIGTSSWLTCHVPFKKTDVFHNLASLPSAIPGRYFIANEQETAGFSLTFLRDNVFFPDDGLTPAAPEDVYEQFNRVAREAPAGAGGLFFLPWLYGERTPIEDHNVRGGFYNMSLHSTRSHMVRAVLEGVALNTRWLLKYVEQFIKRPFPALNLIGGGARSDLWCQIMADVLDRPIRQVQDPLHANARGVGFLAAVGLGYRTFDGISDVIKIRHTYAPNPEHRKLYDDRFKEFQTIYKKNRSIFARLNRPV